VTVGLGSAAITICCQICRRSRPRGIQVSVVALHARDQRIDLDGVVALDRNGIAFVIADRHVGVLRALVTAALIGAFDRLTRLTITASLGLHHRLLTVAGRNFAALR
jgi:hypothetical protein